MPEEQPQAPPAGAAVAAGGLMPVQPTFRPKSPIPPKMSLAGFHEPPLAVESPVAEEKPTVEIGIDEELVASEDVGERASMVIERHRKSDEISDGEGSLQVGRSKRISAMNCPKRWGLNYLNHHLNRLGIRAPRVGDPRAGAGEATRVLRQQQRRGRGRLAHGR